MPIKKATAFTASDGSMHATVEEAQRHELRAFLNTVDGTAGVDEKWLDAIASDLVDQRDAILDILTTGPRSRPSTRKQKGTTMPKRAAKAATPASSDVIEKRVERLRDETFKAGVAAIKAAVEEAVPT